MPTNSNEISLSSDTNGDNVSELNNMAEQQQQQINKIDRRPRFCNDVLLDALHFLRRTEHAHVRLASQRLQWLSEKAYARYPPRVVPRLKVHGVYVLPASGCEPRAEKAAAPQHIIANSIRVYPRFGNSYLANFPAVEPPEDVGHLSELEIHDFVGTKLLQFLRVSSRLMAKCYIAFIDFDNFLRHHSFEFIVRFLALFPSGANRTVHLRHLSSLAVPLFFDHPTLFDCTELIVGTIDCLDTFPLDVLQGWLHLAERQPPEEQLERTLFISFGHKVHVGHSVVCVNHFVQLLKQRFSDAISCCPFTVDIKLYDGPDWSYFELELFVEDNERTGELLEFNWNPDQYRLYTLKRGRRKSTGQEKTEEGTSTTQMDKETTVYINEVVQGDKQPED